MAHLAPTSGALTSPSCPEPLTLRLFAKLQHYGANEVLGLQRGGHWRARPNVRADSRGGRTTPRAGHAAHRTDDQEQRSQRAMATHVATGRRRCCGARAATRATALATPDGNIDGNIPSDWRSQRHQNVQIRKRPPEQRTGPKCGKLHQRLQAE
jgi:hypothetical protein